MLTATPWGRSPADMWALLHWMHPKQFSSYWRFFEQYVQYYKPKGQFYKVIQGPKNLEQLAQEVSPFYRRRTKAEVLDLPALTYTDAPVMINGKQEALYLQLAKEAYAELVGKEIILENALVKFIRLQQCALDPGLMAEGLPPLPLKVLPAKLEWLQEWLEDHPDEPVVIVSRYRKFVEKWLRRLAPEATIVGGMRQPVVRSALREFNKTGRLVGSLDAVKEGLNLQKASTLIVMDGTYSTTAEYQLANRIHRLGSKKPCQVVHLVAKLASSRKYTVDKILRKAVEQKMTNAELVNTFIKSLQDGVCDGEVSGNAK
jgi:SNF2 family DNA or RNA helicase